MVYGKMIFNCKSSDVQDEYFSKNVYKLKDDIFIPSNYFDINYEQTLRDIESNFE